MTGHSDRAHALYAPSAAYRWMRCHGSIDAAVGLPPQPPSAYAEEGTACHEAASAVLEGVPFDQACTGLNEEQQAIVEDYTEFVFDIIEDMEKRGGTPTVLVEKRMAAAGVSRKFFGTGDFVSVSGGLLRVVDLKAGAMPVYVRDREGRINPQLASYVLLALATLGAPVSPWHFDPAAIGVRQIRVSIVQPRVWDRPQTTVIDTEELQEFLGDLVEAIELIEAGDITRVAGDWCGFCPAKGICPTLREAAVERARLDFAEQSNVPFEDLAEVLREAEIIEAHVNGIRQKLRAAILAGRDVAGWKLVDKRRVKKWVDTGSAMYALRQAGFDDDQLVKRTPLGPAPILKMLKHRKSKFDLTPYFDTVPSGVTIVPESDPRPAVKADPGADFAVDDDD